MIFDITRIARDLSAKGVELQENGTVDSEYTRREWQDAIECGILDFFDKIETDFAECINSETLRLKFRHLCDMPNCRSPVDNFETHLCTRHQRLEDANLK
jgi:hypothetical protein